MHRKLLELLICPACLPAERPLKARIRTTRADEVIAAELTCSGCRRDFPVDEGMACLLPPGNELGVRADEYGTAAAVSAYLWSHYADLLGDPRAHGAYGAWAGLLAPAGGLALDAGCAVGRLSFELSARSELVIGVDRSPEFIRAARTLAADGRLTFGLRMEGDLYEPREICLDNPFACQNVEFLLADAEALPFPSGLFRSVSSLNLLDKLPRPRRHLAELSRVAAPQGSELLVADPWSWSTDITPKESWLGGLADGPSAGYGRDNLERLLTAGMSPSWQVADAGTTSWTIRTHRNHYELIDSDYLLVKR